MTMIVKQVVLTTKIFLNCLFNRDQKVSNKTILKLYIHNSFLSITFLMSTVVAGKDIESVRLL